MQLLKLAHHKERSSSPTQPRSAAGEHTTYNRWSAETTSIASATHSQRAVLSDTPDRNESTSDATASSKKHSRKIDRHRVATTVDKRTERFDVCTGRRAIPQLPLTATQRGRRQHPSRELAARQRIRAVEARAQRQSQLQRHYSRRHVQQQRQSDISTFGAKNAMLSKQYRDNTLHCSDRRAGHSNIPRDDRTACTTAHSNNGSTTNRAEVKSALPACRADRTALRPDAPLER